MLDEGASTYIMSYSCWKALGSPTLAASKTILKAFDGHLFTPHGILTAFLVELGGETVIVEVEVVNAPLDYNLLLGQSWLYPMRAIASTIYRLVCFPHQGKIIYVNQLDYCTPKLRFNSIANVPLVSNSYQDLKLVGVGLFKDPYLMGVFPPPVPDTIVTLINMISYVGTYLGDPWVIPNLSEVEYYGNLMTLSSTKLSYSTIQCKTKSIVCFSQKDELDQYSLPEWAETSSSPSHDFLSDTLLSNEAILKAMMMSKRPWEDNHHRSSLLPTLSEEDFPLKKEASINGKDKFHLPSTSYGVSSEGNMSNISKTITIDISVKPGVVERIMIRANCSPEENALYKALSQEFHDIFAWSYEEMSRIDP